MGWRVYSIRYSSSCSCSAVALFFFSMASWTSRMTSLFSGKSSSGARASMKDTAMRRSNWPCAARHRGGCEREHLRLLTMRRAKVLKKVSDVIG
jgi:hypothetical protein